MASSMHKIILIALFLFVDFHISFGDDEIDWNYGSGTDTDTRDDLDDGSDEGNDSEILRYMRDFCSDTKKSKLCWKNIKPEIDRFTDTDIKSVARVIIDIAIKKSNKIRHTLDRLKREAGDDELKEKYELCKNFYNEAKHKLNNAKKHLNSDDYREIRDSVHCAAKELKCCKHRLGTDDPDQIRDMTKEFLRYMTIVKYATKRFVKTMDDNSA